MPQDATEKPDGRQAARGVFRVAAIWAVLFGLYGLFVGSVGGSEALAGLACASLSTLWAQRTGEIGEATLRVRGPMLLRSFSALARLPEKTVRVGRTLIRVLAGEKGMGAVEAHPAAVFVRHPLSDPRPHSQGERAIAVLAASLAPDSYVLRLDAARAEIVTHAFEPVPPVGNAA